MHACRLPLVEASRLWREGTGAFVVVESSTAIDAAPSKFKVSNISLVSCHHECFDMPSAWLPPTQAMCQNTYACADTQDMSYKHADKSTASLSVHVSTCPFVCLHCWQQRQASHGCHKKVSTAHPMVSFSAQTGKLTMQEGVAMNDSSLVALHLHCCASEVVLVTMNGTKVADCSLRKPVCLTQELCDQKHQRL